MDQGPFGRGGEGESLLGREGNKSSAEMENPFIENPTSEDLDGFYLADPPEQSVPEVVLVDPPSASKREKEPSWSKGKVAADERLGEIERREKELAEREAALESREAEHNRAQGIVLKVPNWPPCYPLVRNDIKNDIPAEQQQLVRYGFVVWCATECGYVVNFLISFLMLVTGAGSSLTSFLWCALATGGGIPLSWFMWYQGLYALGKDSSGIFVNLRFFFHFSFHVGFCGLVALSPPVIGYYNSGLFPMIYEFGKTGGIHIFFGILCLVNTILWTVIGLVSLWILKWTFSNFRSGGGVDATQQASSAALIAAKASLKTFGSTATTSRPTALP